MNKKKFVQIPIITSSICISLIFLSTLFFGVRFFVDKEANESLNKYIRLYIKTNDYSKIYENKNFSKDYFLYNTTETIFNVYELKVYEDLSKNLHVNSLEKKLLNYVVSNDLEEFKIQSKRINNKKIYFTTLTQKNQKTILYVDTSSVFYITDLLLIIFVVIFVICILVFGYIAKNLGKKLEIADENLRKFFANASHELKTPLMSIQGYAQGINTGVIKDTKEASNVIIKQSERMEKLVEELLLISKIDSGYLKLEKNEIYICELLDNMISNNYPLTNKKNINVDINFYDEECLIIGDYNQLYKAFENIYSNAIKFTNNSILISVIKDSNNAVITISDNGCGICDDDINHIFDRFYYGKNGSTGVGLSLSKEIIELHKGKICAKNSFGAVFIVTIPLIKVWFFTSFLFGFIRFLKGNN